MKADDINLGQHIEKGDISSLPFHGLPGRIIAEDVYSQLSREVRQASTDIPAPDYAESQTTEIGEFRGCQVQNRRENILDHTLCIATRRVGPCDSATLEIVEVKMIGACCCSSDEGDAAAP